MPTFLDKIKYYDENENVVEVKESIYVSVLNKEDIYVPFHNNEYIEIEFLSNGLNSRFNEGIAVYDSKFQNSITIFDYDGNSNAHRRLYKLYFIDNQLYAYLDKYLYFRDNENNILTAIKEEFKQVQLTNQSIIFSLETGVFCSIKRSPILENPFKVQ